MTPLSSTISSLFVSFRLSAICAQRDKGTHCMDTDADDFAVQACNETGAVLYPVQTNVLRIVHA